MAVPLAVVDGAMSPYDDAKAWTLHVLAGATLLAWLVRRARAPRSGVAEARAATRPDHEAVPGTVRRWPWLTVCVAAYGAWWVVNTALSIVPGQSAVGVFGRGHGLFTIAAALVLFALARGECRDPGAAVRLVDAMLLGGVPVCALALAQGVWDPFPALWDPALSGLTVRSTLGYHLALGAYLTILIPLVLARAESAYAARETEAWAGSVPWRAVAAGAVWVGGVLALVALASRWPAAWWLLAPWGAAGGLAWALGAGRAGRPLPARVRLALLAALLAAQLGVLMASRARGAFLGMLAALAVSGLVLLARRRAWRSLAAAAAMLAAIVALLGFINFTALGRSTLGSTWLLARLARMSEVQRPSPGWVRLEVWRATAEAWNAQRRGLQVLPGTRPRLRGLVGYGLESQSYTLTRFARERLGGLGITWRGGGAAYLVDRAHNDALDHLLTGGLVGVLLGAAALAAVGVAGVGRIRALWLAAPGQAWGTGERSGGLQSGAREGGTAVAEAGGVLALKVGCLGALVASLIEAQVGIATPASRAFFWLLAGVLVAGPPPAPGWWPGPGRPTARGWRLAAVVAGGLLALVVAGASTAWLLGSRAYVRGVQRGTAGDLLGAREAFALAGTLAAGLPAVSEARADVGLRLAASGLIPARVALSDAAAALVTLRRHTRDAAFPWPLAAQVALARWRAGESERLGEARASLDAALARGPDDAALLAAAALLELEAGAPVRARELAGRAVSIRPREWLGWAVLAREARARGDEAAARESAERARAHAPPGARATLDAWLR